MMSVVSSSSFFLGGGKEQIWGRPHPCIESRNVPEINDKTGGYVIF